MPYKAKWINKCMDCGSTDKFVMRNLIINEFLVDAEGGFIDQTKDCDSMDGEYHSDVDYLKCNACGSQEINEVENK